MAFRHPPATNPTRWIIGLVIVIGTVVAFSVYQSHRPTQSALILTATQPAAATAFVRSSSPQPTAKPPTLRLSIGKMNVLTDIVELYFSRSSDWDLSLLNQYAGHLQGTPMIGKGGNVVLAGHIELKDGTPGPFAHLDLLNTGDLITVLRDDPQAPVVKQYSVTAVKTVDPNAINEIRNHGYEELTLVTCLDWDSRTRTYQKRLVVHARPRQDRG